MSSKLVFLGDITKLWRKLLLRLSKMSSAILREFERPLILLTTVGLSGKDSELDLVVTRGGGLGEGMAEPRRLLMRTVAGMLVFMLETS